MLLYDGIDKANKISYALDKGLVNKKEIKHETIIKVCKAILTDREKKVEINLKMENFSREFNNILFLP